MNTISTHGKASEVKPLTLEGLKYITSKISVGKRDTGKKKGWFEKMMNRFGWYRSSEWYLLRENQFTRYPFLRMKPSIKYPSSVKPGMIINTSNIEQVFSKARRLLKDDIRS